MVLKVYKLSGTIAAGSSWSEIDKLTTPTGVTRRVKEIRVYFSAVGNVKIRLYHMTEYLAEIDSRVNDYLKLPYPADVEIRAGEWLTLEGSNSESSDVTVIVELIVDETTA